MMPGRIMHDIMRSHAYDGAEADVSSAVNLMLEKLPTGQIGQGPQEGPPTSDASQRPGRQRQRCPNQPARTLQFDEFKVRMSRKELNGSKDFSPCKILACFFRGEWGLEQANWQGGSPRFSSLLRRQEERRKDRKGQVEVPFFSPSLAFFFFDSRRRWKEGSWGGRLTC